MYASNNDMEQTHEIMDLCLSHLDAAGLARAACLDRHCRGLVDIMIRHSKDRLIIEAVTASAKAGYCFHKHAAAIEWLAKLFTPQEFQQLAEQLTTISDVP